MSRRVTIPAGNLIFIEECYNQNQDLYVYFLGQILWYIVIVIVIHNHKSNNYIVISYGVELESVVCSQQIIQSAPGPLVQELYNSKLYVLG